MSDRDDRMKIDHMASGVAALGQLRNGVIGADGASVGFCSACPEFSAASSPGRRRETPVLFCAPL
jgi:hypothetical protein